MGKSGHRDDRRKRDRDRSRSRERQHYYSEDRRHSGRTDRGEFRPKSISKSIEAVKSHMRSTLDSALAREGERTYETDIVLESDLTVTETASRYLEIERIEEGPFRPKAFQSTSGGAGGRIKKEDSSDRFATVYKKQDAHDKAIFGSKWRDPVEKEALNEDKETYVLEPKKEIELAGPKFFVDPKIREEKWLLLYRERRARLLGL